jgi:glycosyltransferase involved in cell wall biosynthesis
VLYVGTIAPEKGTTVLLDAFARVRARLPDAALVIAGRPNRYFQVRTRSSRAELRAARLEQRAYPGRVEEAARAVGGVLLAGGIPHDELPAYYAAADVFAMPSAKPEPFALPVLEALASGLPIVGTRTGGIPEAVRPGLSGLLVEPGNAEELATVLLDVLGDTEMRVALGSGARALAETEFTWRRAATRLLAMYRSVLDASAVATAPASALA